MFLITGGAGFIGSNIINYLVDRGEEVVSVDWHNNISNKYFQNFNFKVIDPLSLHTFLKTNKKKNFSNYSPWSYNLNNRKRFEANN
tara:strand:- start:316 stop:573 length:258 start_codon:yes stop_codon:yes gene_type:complete